MRWFMLLLLMTRGCGGRAIVGTDGPAPARYRVNISGDFGPITDPVTGGHFQDEKDTTLTLTLSVVPVRRFTDGSMGQRVKIEHGALSISDQPYEDLELTGRTLELRTFPDGEILTLGWVDRVAGPKRFMEVFEVVFPAISPSPPSLRKGETASRRIIWPFLGERRLRWDSAVDAKWTNHGPEERGKTMAWRLSYNGPWRIHGGRRSGPEAFKATASGDAKGQVWFDKGSGDLTRHEFSWSREVQLAGPAARLTQAQSFTGQVERLP